VRNRIRPRYNNYLYLGWEDEPRQKEFEALCLKDLILEGKIAIYILALEEITA